MFVIDVVERTSGRWYAPTGHARELSLVETLIHVRATTTETSTYARERGKFVTARPTSRVHGPESSVWVK